MKWGVEMMMWMITVVVSGFCIVLFLRLILMKREIRSFTKELGQIKDHREAERHLTMGVTTKELEALAVEMNDYIRIYYQERNQYEESVREIRREITNLSHDLRTPLTSILGYLDFMEEDGLTEEQEKTLAIIKRRGYQLNDLVNQIYDYARLESKEYQLQFQKVDLYRILQEHLLSYYPEFEKKGIELSLAFPKEKEAVWILADERSLERVLTNLTSNMLKYSQMESKVSLKVEAEKCMVIYQSERGSLTDYDVKHIFDRFYKADTARVNTQSSGLGLTITRLFVEQMGGNICSNADDEYLYLVCKFPRVV